MFGLLSLALVPSKHCACVGLRAALGYDHLLSWNVQVMSSDVDVGAVGTPTAGLGELGKEPEGTFRDDEGSLLFCDTSYQRMCRIMWSLCHYLILPYDLCLLDPDSHILSQDYCPFKITHIIILHHELPTSSSVSLTLTYYCRTIYSDNLLLLFFAMAVFVIHSFRETPVFFFTEIFLLIN